MQVRYIGTSFGFDSLTDGKTYDVLRIEKDIGALRVIDDSGEDYLYSPSHPRPIAVPDHPGGHWEIVEDNDAHDLWQAINHRPYPQ